MSADKGTTGNLYFVMGDFLYKLHYVCCAGCVLLNCLHTFIHYTVHLTIVSAPDSKFGAETTYSAIPL